MQYVGHILLADDDGDYVVLIQEALHQAGMFNPVEVVSNGLEAVDFLKGDGAYSNLAPHPPPAMVILDLMLPIKHGYEVLRWIRLQPELNTIPVVILSGSGFENEARVAYDLGASAYLVKPAQFQHLVEAIERLRDRFPARVQPFAETAH